ncbi:MAG TPA: leucyl aminopeptidase family protein [Candidatus Paceibacterota bacterium]
MTKITTTNKPLSEVPVKYCRVILTEDAPTWHRLVETKEGGLEYRMGMGKRTEATPRTFRTLVRTIVQAAKSHQIEALALELTPSGSAKIEAMGADWFMRTLAENLVLASYEYRRYKTKPKKERELKEILVCNIADKKQKDAFVEGLIIAAAANITRDIANTTGDDMTPSALAQEARRVFKNTAATVRAFDEKEIKAQKMGLLHAVGKGADDRPRFIIIEYWGAGKPTKEKKAQKPIILIGKGITYDTGGLNVKPSGSMHDMHLDMSGGASVIGAIRAAVDLKLKKNIVGLIPAAENSVSATSMRAGDIVTSMSGQTVEILHTDAEGRLVLADAMTYAQKYYEPALMIDIATLTGASLVALGQHASAILTKDETLQNTLVRLGEESGDLVWPLPLWDEYKSTLKSARADISNIATNFSRFGGCIEGGTFLSFFAPKNIPWAHIDIAPRMDSIASDKLAKGATGEPVRLLVQMIKQHS